MVRRNTQVTRTLEALQEFSDSLRVTLPHLYGVLADEEDFRGLVLKPKDDGTTLAVLKRYASDGTPEVCFGVGYGVFGCLLAVDRVVQGGRWKPDKPWRPSEK